MSGQIEQIARSFGVDWPHLGAQIVSFAIVCVVLYRFAYRPVLAMLDERRRQIAESLANAAKVKAELARTETQRREVLAEAKAEATAGGGSPRGEARPAATLVHREERGRGVAAAGQIVWGAREQAAREHERMLADLKHEVGQLVVRTTAAVAGRVLTAEDQRRL